MHENGEPDQYRDPLPENRLLPARPRARPSPPAPYPPMWRDEDAAPPAPPRAYSPCRGCFGLDTWRGETLRAIVGEKPVRAFCIIKMAAFHQHRATPHRQQRIPLLFHLTFVLRVWRIQQRGGFRQVWRDQRNLRQQLLRRVSTAEAESSGSPLLASITVSSTTFLSGSV